jgi:hypothetical protein
MESGAGFFIVIGIGFLGWLMWSSKTDKEVFLFYSWATLIVVGTLGTAYEFIKRL